MKPPTALEPNPSEPAVNLDAGPRASNRWWVWLLVFALIGFGCYKLYEFETAKTAAVSQTKAMMLKPRAIPVVAASAYRGNMPVYLQGLGSVTAFNTVTVKPRIDGQLTSVNFTEGQYVHQGDLLAEIDARPYQVALEQANAN